MESPIVSTPCPPWDKDKLVGQKRPFKLKEIWAIRMRDVATGDRAAARASVIQQKTGRPAQFELPDSQEKL